MIIYQMQYINHICTQASLLPYRVHGVHGIEQCNCSTVTSVPASIEAESIEAASIEAASIEAASIEASSIEDEIRRNRGW